MTRSNTSAAIGTEIKNKMGLAQKHNNFNNYINKPLKAAGSVLVGDKDNLDTGPGVGGT